MARADLTRLFPIAPRIVTAELQEDQEPSAPAGSETQERIPRSILWIVLVLLAVMVVGVLIPRGSGRLERAIAAAAEYELIDGPAPYVAVDLGSLPVQMSDWLDKYHPGTPGAPSAPSAAALSPGGLSELLAIGKELVATCAPLHPMTVRLPHDGEMEIKLFPAMNVGQALTSVAAGDVPSMGLDERFEATLATLHLGRALTQRYFSGYLVGGVVLSEARRGYEVCVADGLELNPVQRAQLLALLGSIDLEAEARRVHRGTVSTLRAKLKAAWWGNGSAWNQLTYRLVGRVVTDEALSLELAVASQIELSGESTEASRDAMKEVLAEAKGVDYEKFPPTRAGVKLHERLQKTQSSVTTIASWLTEVR